MPKIIIRLKKTTVEVPVAVAVPEPEPVAVAVPEPEPEAVAVPVPMATPEPEPLPVKKRTIIKLGKPFVPQPVEPVQVKKKTIIKLKKQVTVPPPPAPGTYVTKAMEAFEAIREYCLLNNQPITEEHVKWYQDELLQEKKEMDQFWDYCAETKVNMECLMRGDDEWATQMAINAARQKVKVLPVQESDIGPMPEYGTKDFWAWCHKRKKLKEQKDAAIVAAGGKVKEKKPKKVKPQAT
jgi:hypothetical protein